MQEEKLLLTRKHLGRLQDTWSHSRAVAEGFSPSLTWKHVP